MGNGVLEKCEVCWWWVCRDELIVVGLFGFGLGVRWMWVCLLFGVVVV